MWLGGDGLVWAFNGGNWSGDLGTHAIGDVLAVIYDGSAVRYIRNGTVLATIYVSIPSPLFFDSTFRYGTSSISAIRFGPMSSNNWSAIGGNGKPAETVVAKANNAVAMQPGFSLNAYADSDIVGPANSTLAAGFSVNPTGYTGSYSGRWMLTVKSGRANQGPYLSNASGNQTGVSATHTTGTVSFDVTVIVTHSNGLTATATFQSSLTFGNL